MTIIALSLIITLFLFVALGIRRTDNDRLIFRTGKRQILSLLGLLVSLLSMYTIVPANSVGILYSPFTGVRESTLPEGFQVKGPMDIVYKLSTEVQTHSLENLAGQTKDAQYFNMRVDVKYRVGTDNAFTVFKQFRTLENMSSTFIAPTVQRSVESVTTRYNIIEVLGEERNEVYQLIEEDLKLRFTEAGVSFYSITFVETDAGAEIEQAIRAEAIAKKAVETAQQERLKIEIEAQKRVIEAEADQQRAKVEAETLLIEAQAQAEANNKLATSITPELLAKMEMEARLRHGWITVQGGSVITDQRGSSGD